MFILYDIEWHVDFFMQQVHQKTHAVLQPCYGKADWNNGVDPIHRKLQRWAKSVDWLQLLDIQEGVISEVKHQHPSQQCNHGGEHLLGFETQWIVHRSHADISTLADGIGEANKSHWDNKELIKLFWEEQAFIEGISPNRIGGGIDHHRENSGCD